MKRLTSFLKVKSVEGDRITYTYSEIDETTGRVISNNNRGNFVILDNTLAKHVTAIEQWIAENKLNEG